MSPLEHMTTLASCLRGSKEKIYKLIYKTHRRLGTIEEDPDQVFEEIKARHMNFVETPMERQMRVLAEFDGFWKGSKTAHQFEATFEEAITELELTGLAKNERAAPGVPSEGRPEVGGRHPEGRPRMARARWQGDLAPSIDMG